MIIDIHTHNLAAGNTALPCVDPTLPGVVTPSRPFSAGIHPWNADKVTPEAIALFARLAGDPLCLAIGECGLDRRRGPVLQVQTTLLSRCVAESEKLRKPLILHNVGCTAELIALRRESRAAMPWVIHGFRGKPQEAMQLIAHGFMISLGPRFNPLSAAVLPDDRLLIETDDSGADIHDVAAAVASSRHMTTEALLALAGSNASVMLGPGR